MKEKFIKKYILIFIGSVSLVLGFVGIFFPMLPTTPFLLLSSFCYLRSSKKLYNWLINNKLFGAYIYNYITNRAIKGTIKITALITLWLTLFISILIVSNLYLRIFLIIIGIGVSIHILTLKTLENEKIEVILPAAEEKNNDIT